MVLRQKAWHEIENEIDEVTEKVLRLCLEGRDETFQRRKEKKGCLAGNADLTKEKRESLIY